MAVATSIIAHPKPRRWVVMKNLDFLGQFATQPVIFTFKQSIIHHTFIISYPSVDQNPPLLRFLEKKLINGRRFVNSRPIFVGTVSNDASSSGEFPGLLFIATYVIGALGIAIV
jgi:hypothetical protein